MEIFRSVTQTVLGSPQPENQPTGAETVERLLDRVQSSTLLEDRRDGCRALKALSRKYRLLVGAHGMDTLIQVLESERSDHEIINYALETLVNVTSDESYSEEDENVDPENSGKIGEQFTEIFIKRRENVALIVALMDEFDFRVRYPAMKLLSNLLNNRPREMQEAILVTPNAVSKLMDTLADTREVIRNDTLLLLTHLTQGNTALQKIVVFGNCFDSVLTILVEEQGLMGGGVVVEDCLVLMLALLRNNPSNQTLFKEGNYIEKMSELFDVPLEGDEVGWSAQKVANVHYILQLLRTLVSPQSPVQSVSSCQKKMRLCGLLQRLCTLLMAVGVPADILTDTIITVADVIRGNKENQEYFATVDAPSVPPRRAIVVLLMSMVNEKQPFQLRCAVLYCFQSFLYRNTQTQAAVVQTLLPQTAQATQITAGQLLCGGLFSSDPLSNWFSAVALSHALIENTAQKEHLLRVQLATGTGSQPVSLLAQCASLLQGGAKLLSRLGILQLLCTWVANCPIAVSHLLSLPGFIPHLTASLSASEHDESEVVCQGVCSFLLGLCSSFNDDSVPAFTREALAGLVSNRVGSEVFADKVEGVLRAEGYARAAKAPLLTAKSQKDIVFDHEFTRLFKVLEASVVRSVVPSINGSGADSPSEDVTRYKEVIREQDAELTKLRLELKKSQHEADAVREDKRGLEVSLKEYQDKVTSSQLNTGGDLANGTPVDPALSGDRVVQQLQQQLTEMTYARDYYYYQTLEKDALLSKRGETQQGAQAVEGAAQTESSQTEPSPDVENLRKQLEDLQLALYRKDEEIHHLKENKHAGAPPLKSDQSSEIKSLSEKKLCLESAVGALEAEKSSLETRLRLKDEEMERDFRPPLSALCAKCSSLESEMSKLQSEQEDLLVLLTDQESKISEMKKILRSYGYVEICSEDDDDDSENNEADLDIDPDIDYDLSSEDDDDQLT